MQRDLRKNQDNLIIIGTGVIAFGIWSVLHSIMLWLTSPDLANDIVQNTDDPLAISPAAANAITFIILLVLLLADLSLRVYMGRCAISEGRGTRKKQGSFYLFWAGVMATMYLANVALSIIFWKESVKSPVRSGITIAIDLTSAAILIDLIEGKHEKAPNQILSCYTNYLESTNLKK